MTALDASSQALDVARANADRLCAEVRFVDSDYFNELGEQFDLIVSNPPYVATGDVLPPEVQMHEPHMALFAGSGGLEDYRRIAAEAQSHLNLGGVLLVELGDGMAERASEEFEQAGWHVERIVDDLGGTPRVLVVRPVEV